MILSPHFPRIYTSIAGELLNVPYELPDEDREIVDIENPSETEKVSSDSNEAAVEVLFEYRKYPLDVVSIVPTSLLLLISSPILVRRIFQG
jgi:hypothetical protein